MRVCVIPRIIFLRGSLPFLVTEKRPPGEAETFMYMKDKVQNLDLASSHEDLHVAET